MIRPGTRPAADRTDGEAAAGTRLPRLAFVGTGWIGRSRMRAVLEAGAARACSVVDPCDESAHAALEVAPDAVRHGSLEEALAAGPDGVVLATPSALHARQAATALLAGVPVFCQKPLGRTAAETRRVVRAAAVRDLPLGVDLAYRETEAVRRMASLLESGAVGRPYAARLAFHNAYGPDADWYYDPELSGGGCVIDLGIHLVDLALWLLGGGEARRASGRLYADGRLLEGSRPGGADPAVGPYGSDDVRRAGRVEDYATAALELEGGASARLSCSWNLHAGRDAVIEADVRGTEGALSWRNVDGSFYDFTLDRHRGTGTERLCSPPDAWPGRTLVGWARRLAAGHGFDPALRGLVEVARVVDELYRAPSARSKGAPRPDDGARPARPATSEAAGGAAR